MLALMGATETGQVEVADLADQRVNLLLAFADTDRDAAISQAEADAMRRPRRDGWMARGHDHGTDRRPDGPGRRRPGGPAAPPGPRG